MSEIICVTDRKQCRGDFLERLALISEQKLTVVLREKDLSEEEYEKLAAAAMTVCGSIILHSQSNAALRLGCRRIHLPLPLLRVTDIKEFELVGASVHSAKEAKEAYALGADYLFAGHVFETDCKKGLPPRGLGFLREVCRAADIPVYAIGGITPYNAESAVRQGAAGVCVMSGLMRNDVKETLIKYRLTAYFPLSCTKIPHHTPKKY